MVIILYYFCLVINQHKSLHFPSGSGCRRSPPGCVFQRRAVLHGRLPHLCGGAHIWRVRPEERGESKEEDSWQPLWPHDWAGTTGEEHRIRSCDRFFYHLLCKFHILLIFSYGSKSVLHLHRSVESIRAVCWSSSRAALLKGPSWSVEAKLWAWKGSSLSLRSSLTSEMTCALPEKRYSDKDSSTTNASWVDLRAAIEEVAKQFMNKCRGC